MSDMVNEHAVCWAEIPVTDMERGKAFYGTVLGVELNDNNDGPNPMADFPTKDPKTGISGHLYPGKPAPKGTGNTIHLVASDPLDTVMERVKAAGGEVVSPAIDIPAGRFFYAHDPDGNSIGFFNFTN
ncbi:MAG: VOC family protein [Roseitalea sp.]|jgi:predicted enzyme related to lactoylglutathione lyase|nr:VOC family protein [Roseitalea sp.]MBO6723806.1 VOC family protein [Roseitalea sp.]MBO6741828.1 VOC family protein [Roseitalea sp.]